MTPRQVPSEPPSRMPTFRPESVDPSFLHPYTGRSPDFLLEALLEQAGPQGATFMGRHVPKGTTETAAQVAARPATDVPEEGFAVPGYLGAAIMPGLASTPVGKKVLKEIARNPDLLQAVTTSPKRFNVEVGPTYMPDVLAEMYPSTGRMVVQPSTLLGKAAPKAHYAGKTLKEIGEKSGTTYGGGATFRHEPLHMVTDDALRREGYTILGGISDTPKLEKLGRNLSAKLKGVFSPKVEEILSNMYTGPYNVVSEHFSRALDAFEHAIKKVVGASARGGDPGLTAADIKAARFYRDVIHPSVLTGEKTIAEALDAFE